MRRTIFLLTVWFAIATSQISNIQNLFTTKPIVIYTPSPVAATPPTTIKPNNCMTDDDKDGFCVAPALCPGGNALTTGLTNFIFSKQRASFTCPNTEVCCEVKSNTLTTPIPTTPATPLFTIGPAPGLVTTTSKSAGKIVFPSEQGCGRGDIYGFRTIQDIAVYNEFPWVVPIFKVHRGKEQFVAGGSLIHPQLVLTYAIRFVRRGNFVVRAGDYDLSSTSERNDHQTISVKKVITHDKFNSGSMRNNIAILVLDEAVKPANNIGYMCLPSATTRPAPDEECIVVGWGTETMINGTLRDVPKMMRVPLVAWDACVAAVRPYTKPTYMLDDSELCAGGVNYWDVCKGDGGSPLFCEYPNEPNRYYQVGIVSWGLNCGGTLPSMYANVAALRPWIDSIVAAEGFDGKYFTP